MKGSLQSPHLTFALSLIAPRTSPEAQPKSPSLTSPASFSQIKDPSSFSLSETLALIGVSFRPASRFVSSYPCDCCDVVDHFQLWSQVINHGVPHAVIDEMRASCRKFFQQPSELKNVYRSQSFQDPLAYSTSFNPSKEKSNDWKDVLYVRDFPGNHINGFDIVPDIFRKAFQEFKTEVEILSKQLYEAIFESLGISSTYMNDSLPGIPWLAMCVNYYPRCPNPSVTYGSTAHTDGGSLTVLLQDEVPGLWIQNKDEWVQVNPLPDSFVINIGDQIEILSNGRYKSIKHTVITNSEKSRISVACIFGPKEDEKIAPIEELVSKNEPAIYKEITFNDYLYNLYSLELLKFVYCS